MNKKTPAKRAFSTKEAAIYICMSASWLQHGQVEGNREGRISHPPFIKIGRSIRYLIEDLDEWLDKFSKSDSLAQLSVTNDRISRNRK
jgi:predicted DNA-binding transcriptional regulator AlpA